MSLSRRIARLERQQSRYVRFVPFPGPGRPLPAEAHALPGETVIILDTGIYRPVRHEERATCTS